MLRTTKILLILTVVLWGITGAFFNIIDWSGTTGAVAAVISMLTFDGGAESWQAMSSPTIIWIGALFIMLSKLSTSVMCLIEVTQQHSLRPKKWLWLDAQLA